MREEAGGGGRIWVGVEVRLGLRRVWTLLPRNFVELLGASGLFRSSTGVEVWCEVLVLR